jgi:hypothetical protein
MKEILFLEVKRLVLNIVIMRNQGFGASRKTYKGRLGSVSDYCVHHCVCPVVVVRYPDDKDGGGADDLDQVPDKEFTVKPIPEIDDEAQS